MCRTCENCCHCIPIGEGDHICEIDPCMMVLDDYAPSEEFYWCNGDSFCEK